MIHIEPPFKSLWPSTTPMRSFFKISGKIYREPEGTNRRTLRFERDGKGFFIKLHWGVGWGEILKNLISLRLPILGASNEWKAIQQLEQLNIETMRLAAYGQQGWNPARQESFVITEELANTISLEDLCMDWPSKPPVITQKRHLLRRVAEMSRALHQNGINHRDLYICHFLLQQPWDGSEERLHLHLIDLHRVQIRKKTPERWLVKDVGSLHFSAMEIGLTQADLFRFIKNYSGKPLRQALQEDAQFWCKVQSRAEALYKTRPGE
jgi:heptose I phosphotransferase